MYLSRLWTRGVWLSIMGCCRQENCQKLRCCILRKTNCWGFWKNIKAKVYCTTWSCFHQWSPRNLVFIDKILCTTSAYYNSGHLISLTNPWYWILSFWTQLAIVPRLVLDQHLLQSHITISFDRIPTLTDLILYQMLETWLSVDHGKH